MSEQRERDSPNPPEVDAQGRAEKPGLVALEQIPEIRISPIPADAKAEAEKELLGLEGSLSDRLIGERLEGQKQDREERKKYAFRIFVLICAWLGALVLILLLQGWSEWGDWKRFELDRGVLLAFIGGTTLNVLGIFVIVTRYLFSRRRNND